VLAFGDSITNGGGELQWGVALQSWALWVARALGLPFTNYAEDGARASDVVHRQLPAFQRRTARAGVRYDLGCLYIGVNDVRALDWDATTFDADFRRALAFLGECCDRVLVVGAPLDLGRPRAGARVGELNRTIRRAAWQAGALFLDLEDFGARNVVMTDHVHPTAFGQIALAERALRVLEADGVVVRVAPHELISFRTTRRSRLRGDLVYLYRHAKVSVRSAAIQAALRWRPRPPGRT
jgi:lysophospholipase L1-like esterase